MPELDLTKILGVSKLKFYLSEIDSLLVNVVTQDSRFIYNPYQRILKVKSKRLRPSLLLAVAVAGGSTIGQEAIILAAAVEMVHLASLVHDDIIDDAATRHGTPTIHYREGLSPAIIIGDYLLAEAGRLAATISSEAAIILGSAITKLCLGQACEIDDNFNLSRSRGSYFKAISGKTAALFCGSVELGGLVSARDKSHLKMLSEFGENFGIAFQLTDDLLDFISSEQLLAKPVGIDIEEGIYTYPLLMALESTQGNMLKNILQSKASVIDLKSINDLLFSSGAINKTILEIQKYNNLATKSLSAFADDNLLMINLAKLPQTYFKWAITNLVENQYKKRLN